MYVAIRRVAPDVRARGSELHVATIDFSVDAVQKQPLPATRLLVLAWSSSPKRLTKAACSQSLRA